MNNRNDYNALRVFGYVFIPIGIIPLLMILFEDGPGAIYVLLFGLFFLIIGIFMVTKGNKGIAKIDEENMNNIEFDITTNVDNYLYLDEEREKICIPIGLVNKRIEPELIFNYCDILNYELLEDGNSISTGGVGRALVGGALFGGVGAIVGGSTGHKSKQTCTRLQIKITLNDVNDPVKYINFINGSVRKDYYAYRQAFDSAQKVLSTLDIICNPKEQLGELKDDSKNEKSIPEQIKEYKELLDSGAITQEEYNKKKKQLLGSDK